MKKNIFRKKALWSVLLCMIFLMQCKSDKPAANIADNQAVLFYEIDYEKALQNKRIIKLSDIASEIRYIPLETNKKCLVVRKPYYYFSDSLILIRNSDHILAFDYSGRFIRQIGAPGNGPNEIDLISCMSVINDSRTIVVQTNWSQKLLFFLFNGEVIKSLNKPIREAYYRAISDSLFVINYTCAIGNEDYLFMLSGKNWDTLSTVNNHYKWENNTGRTGMWSISDFRPFYEYNGRTYFKSMFNDTVYTVINNEIVPAYFIDLGKCKLPDELRPEPPQSALRFRKESKSYYLACGLETDPWTFISSFSYNGEIHKNILINKNTSEACYLVKQYGEPSGIINDIDYGPEFWPIGSVSENELYMVVSPLTIKDELLETDFDSKTLLYPEKRKEFERMAEELDENNNPVLMLVKINEGMKK